MAGKRNRKLTRTNENMEMSTNTTCKAKCNTGLDLSPLKNPETQKDLLMIFGPIFKQMQDNFKEILEQYQIELSLRDEKIKGLEATIDMLKTNQMVNTVKLDTLEQSQRMNNLIIHGISENEEEHTSDLVIKTIKEELDINLEKEDIDDSYHIGKSETSYKSGTPILVKFTKRNVRSQIYKAKFKLRSRKNSIYINEDLTKKNSELYTKVRALRKEGIILKTWTQNAKIYCITKENEKPITIQSDQDIVNLRENIQQTKF